MLSLTEIKAVIGIVMLLVAGVAGAVVTHKVDAAGYARLELAQQQAATAALQAALAKQRAYDEAALKAAKDEADRQAALAAEANARAQEVKVHVITKYISSRCVPYGFVRVLDAAASGRLAADLPLPAGKSDVTCAPVTWADLARAIVANYDTAEENAEQLNALIDYIRKMAKLDR